MNDGIPFSKINLNGKPLTECEMALECNHGDYRLYIDRIKDGKGFYSIAVEFVSCDADAADIWLSNDLRVEPLFNSTAYYDGVRHLEFNREAGDMAGYIYYPNVQGLIDMLTKLREIEVEICTECDK